MSETNCQSSSSTSKHKLSPDIFSDSSESSQNTDFNDEESQETVSEITCWKGSSIEELYAGKGPWGWDVVSIEPSTTHKVSFKFPLPDKGALIPCKYFPQHCWDQDHVRMPFSNRNLYPLEKPDGQTQIVQRWNLVHAALSKPISNVVELEKSILSYNGKYCGYADFKALRYFLNDVVEREEEEHFFTFVLPKIKELALALPKLLPSSVALLKKGKTCAVSLSQSQIASLLANAFFCTFTRHSVSHKQKIFNPYPQINFNSLYRSSAKTVHGDPTSEKLKCLFNYFRRVTNEVPDGVVTFQRQYLTSEKLPKWDRLDRNFSSTKIHVTDSGTIDENGQGFLQVDFANKYVGGGILGYGCVQEEIRFAVCPELIVACLFTEELGPNEALIITGVEQYNITKGYAESFEWVGDFRDSTPRDLFRRRKCQLVAIDALYYPKPAEQYLPRNMLRDLNKAFVGYYLPYKNMLLQPVATGNWGCGAFRGNPYLKSLLQLMACCMAQRDMVYFTFGDIKLRDKLYDMYRFLVENNITLGQLWKSLCTFPNESIRSHELYAFLIQTLKQNNVYKSGTVTSKKIKNVDNSYKKVCDISQSAPSISVLHRENENESKVLKDQNSICAMELGNTVISEASDVEMESCETESITYDKSNFNEKMDKQTDYSESGPSRKIKVNDISKKSYQESAIKRKITDYFVNISEK